MNPPNIRNRASLYFLAAVLCFSAASSVFAQGTAFTYQGRLLDGSGPANGRYDLRFSIYDAVSGGTLQGAPFINTGTVVSNGLFTVAIDPGAGIFTGTPRWLDIAVRTNGSGSFATL